MKKLAVGVNSLGHDMRTSVVHAEVDASRKLKQREMKKKSLPVVLMSLRFTKDGELRNGMPCYHCIQKLKEDTRRLNYRISAIVYSDSDGNLCIEKFDAIERKKLISSGNREK